MAPSLETQLFLAKGIGMATHDVDVDAMPMTLTGKFASAANARSPIYSMTRRTVDQPADILPLSMLSDVIVAGYHPGDVVLIAMSHPTNFAIGQRDVVNYKRSNLFEHIFLTPINRWW